MSGLEPSGRCNLSLFVDDVLRVLLEPGGTCRTRYGGLIAARQDV